MSATKSLIDGDMEPVGEIRSNFKILFEQIKEAAWKHAGVIRTEAGLRNCAEFFLRLEMEAQALATRNVPKLCKHIQTRNGLLVLRCIL